MDKVKKIPHNFWIQFFTLTVQPITYFCDQNYWEKFFHVFNEYKNINGIKFFVLHFKFYLVLTFLYSPLQKLQHQLGILYCWYGTGNTENIEKLTKKLQKKVTLCLRANESSPKYGLKLAPQK